MIFPKLSSEELTKKLDVPPGKIRLVIDSDAKNEVDDQFAIAWALKSKDRFSVEAVYAAPFSHDCFDQFNEDSQTVAVANSVNGHSENPEDGMEQSYQEILKIFSMLGESPDHKVFRGSREYLKGLTPVESEAARDLVQRAMGSDETLYVAAIAAATNIASAILMEPRIVEKIVVVWLGGHALSFEHGIEFNLIQDVAAAQVLFDSGVPLIWIPCMNVASLLSVSDKELCAHLLGKCEIGSYLSNIVLEAFRDPQTDIAMMNLIRGSSLRGNHDQSEAYLSQFPTKDVAWSRIIWDISTVAALKNPNWVPSRLIPSPVLTEDFKWVAPAEGRHLIRAATYCHRNMIFGDMFTSLTSGEVSSEGESL